ncbi:hypothetical protein YYC_05070 [Plasmodium yoelii 17X]|uniref:Uncharacterized protein n=1 Tax=Plasmodium yoelii 17X TaxID=1323249 RepID=V7PCX0_PLAYE|nr:hypothetical protein YYC_05070 [Plasmodium yoelii 17X]
MYLPDNLGVPAKLEIKRITNYDKYCPNNNCDTDLDKITIGFLWLLEQCYSAFKNKSQDINSVNAFFIYIISWFSYKLKQNFNYTNTPINDFYNQHVKNNDKYKSFTSPAYTIGDLGEFMDERNDLLNINIEDMSKFYDALKLICSMYSDVTMTKHDTLPTNAIMFVKKYQELNNDCNIKGTARSKIFSALSTDYNNLKEKCKDFKSLPEITANISALTSGDTSSSSSIGNKLFTVLSIIGAIAFFLGISYKRKNKKYKEENESLICDSKSSDNPRNSNNS